MKIYALLLALTLTGCTSTQTYYSTSLDTPESCWARDKASNYIKLADGVLTSFQIGPSRTEPVTGLTLGISLANGQTFQLENNNWELQLENPTRNLQAAASRFQLGIYGTKGKPGYSEYAAPTDVLTGSGRNSQAGKEPYLQTDNYMAWILFPVISPDRITLKLPPLIVNGKRVILDPIKLFRITKDFCVPLA